MAGQTGSPIALGLLWVSANEAVQGRDAERDSIASLTIPKNPAIPQNQT